MNITYILYNPYAGNNQGKQRAEKLKEFYPEEDTLYVDMTKIHDYVRFLLDVEPTDCIVLCGGDGTLNRFVNETDGLPVNCSIFYYPVGSGNDFAREIKGETVDRPFEITAYLRNLPYVLVGGQEQRFLNGIGYGIDGYCCEVGDKLRETSDKPVNYTAIAIKGLLFHFKPVTATVKVDGVTHIYKKAWLAPTMHGRYYGGGMIPTPQQDRNDPETLSVMVMHGAGKLKTLMVFPSIFKGEHIKHSKMVEVLTGQDITVEFDRPTPLQIDGETILNITSYRALSTIQAMEKGACYDSAAMI